MSYSPTNWTDGTTPVDRSNLNKIEDALVDQDERIDANTDLIDSFTEFKSGSVTANVEGTVSRSGCGVEGNLGYVYFQLASASFSGSTTVIATLPTECRPKSTRYIMGRGTMNGDIIPVLFQISSNGQITQIISSTSTFTNITIAATYPM